MSEENNYICPMEPSGSVFNLVESFLENGDGALRLGEVVENSVPDPVENDDPTIQTDGVYPEVYANGARITPRSFEFLQQDNGKGDAMGRGEEYDLILGKARETQEDMRIFERTGLGRLYAVNCLSRLLSDIAFEFSPFAQWDHTDLLYVRAFMECEESNLDFALKRCVDEKWDPGITEDYRVLVGDTRKNFEKTRKGIDVLVERSEELCRFIGEHTMSGALTQIPDFNEIKYILDLIPTIGFKKNFMSWFTDLSDKASKDPSILCKQGGFPAIVLQYITVVANNLHRVRSGFNPGRNNLFPKFIFPIGDAKEIYNFFLKMYLYSSVNKELFEGDLKFGNGLDKEISIWRKELWNSTYREHIEGNRNEINRILVTYGLGDSLEGFDDDSTCTAVFSGGYIPLHSTEPVQVNMEIQRIEVVAARPRRLRTNWTGGARNDLERMHEEEHELAAVMDRELRVDINDIDSIPELRGLQPFGENTLNAGIGQVNTVLHERFAAGAIGDDFVHPLEEQIDNLIINQELNINQEQNI